MNLNGWIGQMLNHIYSLPWWVGLLLGLFITPVGMFLVGGICEHRILPIGKVQSIAFLPGDIFLCITFAASIYGTKFLPAQGWWQNSLWPTSVFAIAILHVVLERLWFDAPYYRDFPGATPDSPTKWWHDIMAYVVYFTMIIVVAVPVFLNIPWTSDHIILRIAIIAPLICFSVCLVYDAIHPPVYPPSTEGRRPDLMHPDNWKKWILDLFRSSGRS